MSAWVWFLAGWFVHALLTARWNARRDAMNRRIGWGYGYGAGVDDGKHGRYEPGAPRDGRSRVL